MATSRSVVWRALSAANAAVDRVRVELQGAYDCERLRELAAYHQRAGSLFRAALRALLTPVPCYAVLVALDALPLAPIQHGVHRQTVGFWYRSALAGATMTCIAIGTMAQSVPALPMSTWRLWWISLCIGVILLPTGYMLALFISFPLPFALQFQTPLWITLVLGAAFVSWRDTVQVNTQAREDLTRVLGTLAALIAIIITYAVFSCVFTQLSPSVQAAVSCVLPVLKIAFKNWVDKGLRHSPHLKPRYLPLDQTAAGTALLVLVVVDVAQSVVAVWEVVVVARVVRETQVGGLGGHTNSQTVKNETTLGTTQGPTELRAATYPVTSPRLTSLTQVVPVSALNQHAPPKQGERDRELATARAVLKILFMTEFYVLTEYVEAIVALIYGAYLYALSYLPSRIYYTQLATLSPDELRDKAQYVLTYALYELLSFVALCVAVNRVMERFSLVGQLGFVLEKHWWLVQMLLVFWILFVVQSTLEHLGTDYTFQFKWLKAPP